MKILASGPSGPVGELDPLRAAGHEVVIGRPRDQPGRAAYSEAEPRGRVHHPAGDRVEMRGEDDVGVARGRPQLGLGVRGAPGLIERPADHHLVPGRAERVELGRRPAGTRGQDLHGFLQITLRTTWRFSSVTIRSPRRRASASAAGSSTFSPCPPEARQIIS